MAVLEYPPHPPPSSRNLRPIIIRGDTIRFQVLIEWSTGDLATSYTPQTIPQIGISIDLSFSYLRSRKYISPEPEAKIETWSLEPVL